MIADLVPSSVRGLCASTLGQTQNSGLIKQIPRSAVYLYFIRFEYTDVNAEDFKNPL